MSRVRFRCAALAAALCALAAAPASAATGPRLTEAGEREFPARSFVLTGPDGVTFAPGRVNIRENGRPVKGLSVTPAASVGGPRLATVLVIDASGSMRGRPIRAATKAARALAARRADGQPLAVIAFNRRPRVLLPFTTDERRIRRALDSPPNLGPSTRIYDAVTSAVRLVRQENVAVGSVVVLSDGADSGTGASQRQAAQAAREAGIRLFTVGLHSSSLDPRALRRLATAGRGRYFRARSTRELAPIYDELGAQFAREFLIRYRSEAGPGLQAVVEASVDGIPGTARTSYLTPSPRRSSGPATYERPGAESFWGSTLAFVLVSFGCALPVAFVAVTLLRRRNRTMLDRMRRFVALGGDDANDGGGLPEVLGGAERSLERTSWWPRFKEEVELARMETPPMQLAVRTALGTILAVFLLYVITGTVVLALIGFAVPFAVKARVERKLKEQRGMFAEQLADNCEVLASAMRAGHSLVGGLSVLVDEAIEPSKTEFAQVVSNEQLGIPVERTMTEVARRMDSKDLGQIAMVAAMQRDAGGNTAEILDRVTETIRQRFTLRRLVDTLTAQGRLSRWVLTGLPVVLLLAMTVLNRDYASVLFDTTGGQFALTLAGVLLVAGSLVIKKIVDIKI